MEIAARDRACFLPADVCPCLCVCVFVCLLDPFFLFLKRPFYISRGSNPPGISARDRPTSLIEAGWMSGKKNGSRGDSREDEAFEDRQAGLTLLRPVCRLFTSPSPRPPRYFPPVTRAGRTFLRRPPRKLLFPLSLSDVVHGIIVAELNARREIV